MNTEVVDSISVPCTSLSSAQLLPLLLLRLVLVLVLVLLNCTTSSATTGQEVTILDKSMMKIVEIQNTGKTFMSSVKMLDCD